MIILKNKQLKILTSVVLISLIVLINFFSTFYETIEHNHICDNSEDCHICFVLSVVKNNKKHFDVDKFNIFISFIKFLFVVSIIIDSKLYIKYNTLVNLKIRDNN